MKFWTACTQMQIRESDQLKTVLAPFEQDVVQKDMPPSYQRLKTMLKQFLDQKVRARVFAATNERTVDRTTGEEQKRRESVSVEAGRLLSMESKRRVYKGRCLQFRHAYSKRGASTRSSSPTSKPQTNKRWEKFFRKASRREEVVRLGKGSRTRAKITSKGSAQIHQDRPEEAGCSFLHKETDRQPKRRKKGGVRFSCPCSGCEAIDTLRRGTHPRRHLARRAMGSKRSLGAGKKVVQSQRKPGSTQSHVLLTFGGLVSSRDIHN